MQQKLVTIQGQVVSCCESAGTGHPVVLLHGNSLSARCFEKQFNSPLGQSHRLIALDLPGHGDSARAVSPDRTYTLPGYAALVTAFVRELSIEHAFFVGWSLGGHILLEAAEQLPDAAGMILFGAPPVSTPLPPDAFISHPAMQLLFKRDLSDDEVEQLACVFSSGDAGLSGCFAEAIRAADGKIREVLGYSVATGNYTDEVAVAAALKNPVALFHGADDPLVNLAYLQGLKIPTLWRGAVQIIPGAGHAPHWVQPERFNRLLEEFISDCSSPGIIPSA